MRGPSHLERITKPSIPKWLVNRGGLRADIVSDGRIAVGDEGSDLGPAWRAAGQPFGDALTPAQPQLRAVRVSARSR